MSGARGVFVGLTTVDLIHRVAHPVSTNEKVTALDQEIVAGGPAANAAITFALLGGDAVLVTDLGSHPLAELARHDMSAYGVTVRAVEPDNPVTPAVSAIRVLDGTGERSVVSVNAAARTVGAPAWLPSVLDGAAVLLLDGHHPLLAVAAARAARERGLPVMLDAGSWKPVLDELLPLVDVAICSADFRLPPAHPGSGVDLDAVGSGLRARGVLRVAITRGPDPVLWWSGRPDEQHDPGRSAFEHVVLVPSVRVRDTLGAGDVFHGSFAWHLADRPDRHFARQLARAATEAAQRCEFVGISSWRNHLRNRLDH
ncbi:MAG TPA: PfkB family carbohydrate kinase [Nakamurella sp.]